MSTVSPNLSLPYIQQNQAQKHVTHNEGMRLLDGVVQLSVLSRAQTAPPANPVAGDRYILPSGATGAWAGFDDSWPIEENAWRIIPPNEGWVAWDQNGLALLVRVSYRRHRCALGQAWAQHIRRFDKPIGGFLVTQHC